jgi:Dual specificity phosphatase, catalytic domain
VNSLALPIRDSYRVAEGLLAGEYPGANDPEESARRLRRFEECGVKRFIDLTHPADLLEPYHRLLRDGHRIAHPIVDMGTTTIPHMARILNDIDVALADGEGVYVHCWGGIGRTGTVIGCWLVRHGLDNGDAIRTIETLRRLVLDSFMPSPQTTAQRAMVTTWKQGR